MLRVWSDILTSADVRKVTDITWLTRPFSGFSFNCVDHYILLHGLEVVFCLTNTVLEWIRSFLSDLTQCKSRTAVANAASTVRRAARVSARSTATCAVT